MSGRFALIIANTEYTDSGLAQLTAPGVDAKELARVLDSRDLCAFDDVIVLYNESASKVSETIDYFLSNRTRSDLLVLYFSGHGVRDEYGSLYLAVTNTNRARLRSTAIKSDFIREAMDQSHSKRQVLILDCCNSGAFAQGTKAEIGGSIGTAAAFEGTGYGRVVLTASDATQFAWEGDKVIGETRNSLFTNFLIKGLEGEADLNGDGRITIDELYDYAFEQIINITPKQTPGKWSYKQQGELIMRQNIQQPLSSTRTSQLRREKIEQEVRFQAEKAALEKQLEEEKSTHEKLKAIQGIAKEKPQAAPARWKPIEIGVAIITILAIGYAATRLLPAFARPVPTATSAILRTPTEEVSAATEGPVAVPVTGGTATPTQEEPTATQPATDSATATASEPLPEIIDNVGIAMVLVPEGNFSMGSNTGDDDEKPIHAVHLDAYYIDKFEVTNARYQDCVNADVCEQPVQADSFTRSSYYGNSQYDNYPVVYVDWDMANAYCDWRDARLPTEAQWEKAARGSDERTYPWGREIDCQQANYQGCINGTSETGTYESGRSPYGAYDMAGNVWEWVTDWYSAEYYQSSPHANPLGLDVGRARVLRGGSWSRDPYDLRTSNRVNYAPTYNNFDAGFRCASPIPD